MSSGRKPVIPGWKTVSERTTKKPGKITKEEILQAAIGYSAIKKEAYELVTRAINRGWISPPGISLELWKLQLRDGQKYGGVPAPCCADSQSESP